MYSMCINKLTDYTDWSVDLLIDFIAIRRKWNDISETEQVSARPNSRSEHKQTRNYYRLNSAMGELTFIHVSVKLLDPVRETQRKKFKLGDKLSRPI